MIVIVLLFDQVLVAWCSSRVCAFIWYVPGVVHWWSLLAVVPELTRLVQVDICPSSQSNLYCNWSPSGSVALVLYVPVCPEFRFDGPVGVFGVFGLLFGTSEIVTVRPFDQSLIIPF